MSDQDLLRLYELMGAVAADIRAGRASHEAEIELERDLLGFLTWVRDETWEQRTARGELPKPRPYIVDASNLDDYFC